MTLPIRKDLVDEFAETLSGLAESRLADDALFAAKMRILDSLSVTFNGLEQPASVVAYRSIAPCRGSCTLIGRRDSASALDAAFVNAVTGHTTLQEDHGGGGHPGTYIVPAVLALAEQEQCEGSTALTALIVGYEAAQRLAAAAGASIQAKGFRAVPTVGVIAAAAAASVILQLNSERLAAALSWAANMAGGLYQGFADGTMEGYFHAGFAARSAIFAVVLSSAGGNTSPQTLEGSHGFFSTFAGGTYSGAELTEPRPLGVLKARSKPFPACALNQDTMTMIRVLQPEGINPAAVHRIVLRRPRQGPNSYRAPGVTADPPYHNMLQTQMSAKFTAVAALLGRPVTEVSYFTKSFTDPEVQALAGVTTLAESDDDAVTLEVSFKDGRTTFLSTSDVEDLSWDTARVVDKFHKLATPKLGDRAHRVVDLVENLERLSEVGELMQLVKG